MIKLAKISTKNPKEIDKSKTEEKTAKLTKKIGELIETMWAEKKHSLLVVFQGMDASGKDGAFKNVFHEVPHAAVIYQSYGKPTAEEFAHDFLWRIHQNAPAKGQVSASIRSHYEDILIQRVKGWIDEKRVGVRMNAINAYEKLLEADNNTVVLKFYMHISPETQLEKLAERIEKTEKNWKHKDGDWEERKSWDAYMKAYEYAINKSEIPWTIVPADERWYRDYIVAEKVYKTLQKMKVEYVKLGADSPAQTLLKSYQESLPKEKKETEGKSASSDSEKAKKAKLQKTDSPSSKGSKSGSKSKKVKVENVEIGAEKEVKSVANKKRGRKSSETKNEAVSKPITELNKVDSKRGRKPNTSSTDAQIKQGRKTKDVSTSIGSLPPASGKRGRKPKVESVATTSAPLKRGRKTKVENDTTTVPAKRGRKPKVKSTTVTSAKRGTNPKAEKPTQRIATKRGRKPKTKSTLLIETLIKNAADKRGRKPKVVLADTIPAKRGRKPGQMNKPTSKAAQKNGLKPNK